ncbi:MAG: M48 family metalloprotease [Proteobacteria bacterium]|nr:M48 family metalloprotease [Pseudomonadota bacterium]
MDRQAVVRASAATAVAAAVVFDGDADVPRPVADAPRPTGPCRIGGSVYRLVTGDDCLAAMKAQAVFDRLAPAAGFAKHDLSFRLMADGSSASMAVNAYYNDPMKTVYVTHGMLRQYGADAAVLVAVIAHELGHAVTDREMPFTSASCYAGGLPCPYDRRQFEALADMRGGQIAARAGFPAKMVAAGFETFFGSLNVRFGPEHDERYVHPSDRDRWLNVAAYQAAINRKHESLAPGFVPAIGLEAFTPSGVIVPSALVPEARLKTYARAAMDAQLPPKPEALDAPVLYNYAIARQFLRDRASRAIVAAVDRFVEPPDSRKAPFDRGVAPWAPLRWDVPEAMTARLLKAISGDAAEELVRSLPPLLRKN